MEVVCGAGIEDVVVEYTDTDPKCALPEGIVVESS